MRIACFSCGNLMEPLWSYTGWCDSCQVREVRNAGFISEVRTVKSLTWWNDEIIFLDHSSGYYPNP